jgi:1-acyl-sn-glycerol-3-phosphate acyltransferase
MNRLLVGCYTYAEFAACTVAWLPIMLATRLAHRRDATPRVPGRWLRRLARVSTRLSPTWHFTVEGKGPPDIAQRPYVVIANHESSADPFLLSFLPWDMRWVAKEELFRVPLVGWLLRLAGEVPIRRGDKDSAERMMAICRDTLAKGLSVMIFPEGTRSRDGELLPFKDGAFQLAIAAQVPVLPVCIEGTRACLPKGSPWLGNADASVRILSPIPTAGMSPDDVPRLRELARRRLSEARQKRATPCDAGA